MKGIASLAAATILAGSALSAPDVTYTVSGSPGSWILDFSVTNTLGVEGMYIYFFGVIEDGPMSSPDGWNPDTWPTWSNATYGGSATVYFSNWLGTGSGNGAIQNGETKSGFQVHTSGTNPPEDLKWFAFAYSENGAQQYGGDDHFYLDNNPGFEGTATLVPEPASLMALGVGALALWRRRARQGG